MDNNIGKQFGGWPFRYVVIEENILKFKMDHNYNPNINSLITYLETHSVAQT